MNKKVVILKPRLDVPFKNLGPVPAERGPIPEIRMHWFDFVEGMKWAYQKAGYLVDVVEKPLWQFTPHDIIDRKADIAFVPHKEHHAWSPYLGISGKQFNYTTYYYMQSVFPWLFYVDQMGYAGGASFYPITIDKSTEQSAAFELASNWVNMGSKFPQPPRDSVFLKYTEKNYVLFTCQLPHDHTIKYHSDVSVETALQLTLESAHRCGKKVLVKGHPINPGSMEPLKAITKKYNNAVWLDGISIHTAIEHSSVVATVNSGTGMEALLLQKPVITFGRCEYDCVTMRYDPDYIDSYIKNPQYDLGKVKTFIDIWMDMMYDSRDVNSLLRKIT